MSICASACQNNRVYFKLILRSHCEKWNVEKTHNIMSALCRIFSSSGTTKIFIFALLKNLHDARCIEILEFFQQVYNNCPQYLSQLVFVCSVNVKCLIYSIQFIHVKGTDLFFSRCSVNKPKKLSFVYYILNDCLALKELTSCKAFCLPPKKSTSRNLMMFYYISTQEDTDTVDSQLLQ